MKRMEATAAKVQAIREKDVRVAINDFGTEYSSPSYLHNFPQDIIITVDVRSL